MQDLFISKFPRMHTCSIRHFLTSKPFFNFIRIWIIVVRRHLIGSLSPNRELSHSLMDAITTFVSRCASTLKFDFLWDKTAKTTSSNVRVTIVYFVIYRESYTFIFSFKIDIYSYIWKLKYTMPPSWCVFRSKIMSNDQAVILLDDIAIIFHFDESRLCVLMCYLFEPLIIILT